MELLNKTALINIFALQENVGQMEGVPKNPRFIKDKDYEALKVSILLFPTMLFLRPITYAIHEGEKVILGGNQRRAALVDIYKLTIKQVKKLLEKNAEFQENPEADQNEIIEFWERFLETGEVPAQDGTSLSVYKKKEFVIKDNIGFGETDFSIIIADWGRDKFEAWGGKVPAEWIDPEKLGTDFNLPSGDKNPFQQMTFTLSDLQAEEVKKALSNVKQAEAFKECDFDNTNSNGNALFFIVQKFLKTNGKNE